MFQALSWIAAHLQDKESLKFPPHSIPAAKGLDGFHLVLDPTQNRIVSMVICEDKATTNPRSAVRDEIWPAFRRFEAGERDNELVAKTATLLKNVDGIDAEEAVRAILWERVRSYRIAITVGDKEVSLNGQNALFKGYDEAVKGSTPERRRAEVFYQKHLRTWMQRLATKAIAVVNATA